MTYAPGIMHLGAGSAAVWEDRPAATGRNGAETLWFNVAYEKVGCNGVLACWPAGKGATLLAACFLCHMPPLKGVQLQGIPEPQLHIKHPNRTTAWPIPQHPQAGG